MRNDILEEAKKQKALSRRFRQPICKNLNLMAIQEFLHDAKEAAEDVAYAISDDDVLVDIMDGNTDQAHEFMMTFSLLAGDLERFADDLEEQWVPECLRIAAAYLGLKTRYDDLSDALAIIRAENDGLLDAIRKVSAAYEDAEKAGFQDEKGEHFDKLLFALPAECWLR